MVLLGDCMLGRLVDEVLESAPPEYPWGDTLPILRGANLRISNLECVISDRGTPGQDKVFQFRSAAKNIAVLQAAHVDMVSLANNHILDYGEEALFQMLEILDRAGIAHSGAGRNLDQASQVAIADACGVKVGLLALTDNEPSWEATVDRPGVFYVPVDLGDPRSRRAVEIVRGHRDSCDLLVVSLHWGSNWGYQPERGHITLAHALVDAGADIIFGHSSHVFRGIEFYKGRPVVYGAGDFVDDYAVDPIERNDQGFIYIVDLPGGIIRGLRLYPTLIRGCRVGLAGGVQERSIVEKMQNLCGAFHTTARWNRTKRCLEVGSSAREDSEPAHTTAGRFGV